MYDNERAVTLQYAAGEDPCSESVALDSCADTMICELEDISPETRGRIIELTVRVCNVCPGKRTALGVMLHETGGTGRQQPRGMKAVTIPAHNEAGSRDILVRGIRFVLPEDISLAGEGEGRQFAVRTIAHYIDIDDTSACGCRARQN